jgi:hypothetical protein
VEESLEDYCPFDATVFFGDLNYRLDVSRLEVELFKATRGEGGEMGGVGGVGYGGESASQSLPSSAVQSDIDSVQQMESLLEYDQLTRERMLGRAFRGFIEGRVAFMPTFKYDKGSDRFDSSGKHRPPAWTDRVLYRVAEGEQSEGQVGVGAGAGAGAGGAKGTPAAAATATAGSSETETTSAPAAAVSVTAAEAAATIATPIPTDSNSTLGQPTTPSNDTSRTSQDSPILQLVDYRSIDARHSDHRPVCARFVVTL